MQDVLECKTYYLFIYNWLLTDWYYQKTDTLNSFTRWQHPACKVDAGAKMLHSQKLLKCQEMPYDVYKMRKNASRPGLHPAQPRTPLRAYSAPLPRPGGKGSCYPSPKNSNPALGLSGLACPHRLIFRSTRGKILVQFLVPANVLRPLTLLFKWKLHL